MVLLLQAPPAKVAKTEEKTEETANTEEKKEEKQSVTEDKMEVDEPVEVAQEDKGLYFY